MHAAAIAKELNIREVIIPRNAAVLSALGMLMADMRRDEVRTHIAPFIEREVAGINDLIVDAITALECSFVEDGVPSDEIRSVVTLKLRYSGQDHPISLKLDGFPMKNRDISELHEKFQRLYEQTYSYRLDYAIEIVGIHATSEASVIRPNMPPEPPARHSIEQAEIGQREVDFDLEGTHLCSVYSRDALGPGHHLAGPCIIQDAGTTIPLLPGQQGKVDELGNIRILPITTGRSSR